MLDIILARLGKRTCPWCRQRPWLNKLSDWFFKYFPKWYWRLDNKYFTSWAWKYGGLYHHRKH